MILTVIESKSPRRVTDTEFCKTALGTTVTDEELVRCIDDTLDETKVITLIVNTT